MVKIYSDEDLMNVAVQRKKILAVFYIVTAVLIAAIATMIVFYTQLPYNDPNGVWMTWVTGGIVAIYICFCFPYMGIKYKRCNDYYKMLKYISVGLKDYSVSPFVEIDDWTTHDGVDVNVANFAVRGGKKREQMMRAVYVDGEKDFPPFEKGDWVRLVTQGSLLVEYEILGKLPARDEEEEDVPERIKEDNTQEENIQRVENKE